MQSASVRNKVSGFSLLFLIICVVVMALYAEMFRRRDNIRESLGDYSKVFDSTVFGEIYALQFKNRIGNLSFEKEKDGKWKMTSPRKITARRKTVEEIIKMVKDLNIIKVYEKDQINISNFALENPALEISISNEKKNLLVYQFGLINPIDNSTYITSNHDNVIFQVEASSNHLETYSLANFIESKIFSVPIENIKEFSIFRGKSKKSQLHLKRVPEGWKTTTGRLLQKTNVNSYFKDLGELGSSHILDKTSEELEGAVQKHLESPLYHIKIVDSKDKEYQFEISHLVSNLPSVNIKKRQNVIIKASHRKYVYLFPKSILDFFKKTQYSFKKLKIEKIFY